MSTTKSDSQAVWSHWLGFDSNLFKFPGNPTLAYHNAEKVWCCDLLCLHTKGWYYAYSLANDFSLSCCQCSLHNVLISLSDQDVNNSIQEHYTKKGHKPQTPVTHALSTLFILFQGSCSSHEEFPHRMLQTEPPRLQTKSPCHASNKYIHVFKQILHNSAKIFMCLNETPTKIYMSPTRISMSQ